MIIIKDNVFEPGFGEAFFNKIVINLETTKGPYGSLKFYEKDKNSPFYTFINYVMLNVSDYFNLSKMKGTEVWYNDKENHELQMHIDHDEAARIEDDFLFKPICNIIYYPLAIDDTAGKLCLPREDMIIPAKKNRMIIMSNDTLHGVTTGHGKRPVILMNPFNYIPKTHI